MLPPGGPDEVRQQGAEVPVVRLQGVPGEEFPEDLVGLCPAILRLLCQEVPVGDGLGVELEDLPDLVEVRLGVVGGPPLDDCPIVGEGLMHPVEVPILEPVGHRVVHALQVPEGREPLGTRWPTGSRSPMMPLRNCRRCLHSSSRSLPPDPRGKRCLSPWCRRRHDGAEMVLRC